jgi:UDP-glucose 4-epimerase
MSILVTGGAGYIGSHMVHELADAGERVVVLDNLSTGFSWAVPASVPLILGDTGDQNLVAQIIREHEVGSIIHFAAWLVVPDSVRDPLGYYKNDTVNSRGLIEAAVRNGVYAILTPAFIVLLDRQQLDRRRPNAEDSARTLMNGILQLKCGDVLR